VATTHLQTDGSTPARTPGRPGTGTSATRWLGIATIALFALLLLLGLKTGVIGAGLAGLLDG
jgi:hypothetical protein